MKRCFILMVIFGLCLGDPAWETLRVTWGIPGKTPNAYAPMPRTIEEAKNANFQKISQNCRGKFLGNRYMIGNDSGVILLFDVNGYIAGLQTALPKKLAEKVNTDYSFESSIAYQKDKINNEDYYVLTTYFVDPEIICTTGRSRDDFDEEGTGTDLYIQNGNNPIQDSMKIPLYNSEFEHTKTNWKKGGCFESMGLHYWYNVREDLPCSEIFPFFLLYNRGKLTGYGFANIGLYRFTSRYEYPPESIIEILIKPLPKCLPNEFDKAGGFSTLHVYFNVRPENLKC